MGLSGSGKSTVVRCLSRLVEPTDGRGADRRPGSPRSSRNRQLIELRRHKMGMVFQNFGLLPHLNVLENVAYPLRVQGVPRAERERRAREMIELVGLGGRETSAPRELSGGMQQRVGIARSLAVKPDIWFLDEPVQRARPADPPPDAGRVPAAAGQAQEDDRLHHARFPRGAASSPTASPSCAVAASSRSAPAPTWC